MSKSISDLISSLQKVQLPSTQEKLNNPDIPGAQYDETEEIRDMFHLSQRLPPNASQPRNGAGYYLESRSKARMDPRKQDFLMESSIDPNIIRSKTDPDGALPSRSSQSLHSLMPSNIAPPRNQESLIRMAHTSELNWRNRFLPQQVQPTQPA
jgi:hypothetical protein